jgi:polyhydroxyalkanoate synthesis regulator phasin
VKKGLNRFVWDMRHAPMIGIPNVYYEASFRGHKAMPGTYEFVLEYDGESSTTKAEILLNPLYPSTPSDYATYHTFMQEMENNVNEMHKMVNDLYSKNEKLSNFLNTIKTEEKHKELHKNGQILSDKIKAFDNDMVQRLSKAYDDVENHLNKFTSNYMYILNQTESEIPVVTKGAQEEKAKHDLIWQKLKARGQELINKDLPAYNQQICVSGIGTI